MRKLLALLIIVTSGACARLDYDTVNIHGNVVPGGQVEIDQGKIVHLTWITNQIWIVGHRTTHGAVFYNLTRARIGDIVCVYSKCYTVFRFVHLSNHTYPGYLGPLVLQTSEPPDGLFLVVAR